jgi:hypothetical protein
MLRHRLDIPDLSYLRYKLALFLKNDKNRNKANGPAFFCNCANKLL